MAGIAEANYRYRGREITAADILYIGELIGANPGASRRTISKKLCEAWEWRRGMTLSVIGFPAAGSQKVRAGK